MTYASHGSTTANRWSATLLRDSLGRTIQRFHDAVRRKRQCDLLMDRVMRTTSEGPVDIGSLYRHLSTDEEPDCGHGSTNSLIWLQPSLSFV